VTSTDRPSDRPGGLPTDGARDGWRNGATAQMAEQIREDPVLLLDLGRFSQTFAQIIDQAGQEAAAAWYGRLDSPSARLDDIDWPQIGEHLLHRLLRRVSTLDRLSSLEVRWRRR